MYSCSWCYCWSFISLDAAWHGWSSIALAVMIDGMLAVSAQCGCCHHFHSGFSMPFHVFSHFVVIFYAFCPFFLLACCMFYCMYSGFVIFLSSLFCIWYYMVWCLVIFCFWYYMVYVLWVLWVIFWWGVLFTCLCTTTYVCIPYDPYGMYSFTFFCIFPSFVFCIPISWCTLPLVLLFLYCVVIYHDWMKTFGGCMHMYFIICSYMCILKYVYSI